MMKFREYIRLREGLWLPDERAVVGLSKIRPPKPPEPPKPRKKPPVKVLPSPKPAKPVLRPPPLRPNPDK